jgi:hypothetical protein
VWLEDDHWDVATRSLLIAVVSGAHAQGPTNAKVVGRVSGLSKDVLHYRPEELERQRVVVGIEAVLVEALAELDAVFVEGIVDVPVAGVSVLAPMRWA